MNKEELRTIHRYEKELYFNGKIRSVHLLRLSITKEHIYLIWKYVYLLRNCEYHKNKNGPINKILLVIHRRRKNTLGLKLGLELHENCFEEGLLLYHGNVVVNSHVKCGKNCKLHGMNCIGNNAMKNECPVLGDNVEIGMGAMILGEVFMHNNTFVGANSVVLSSTNQEGTLLVGSPAKEIVRLDKGQSKV